MSFFDKIKSAVMGNPVTREFELGKHVASAGPGLLWKVHQGVKKTSRQEVSIFVLDKKAPEFEKLSKKQKEAIYDMLKKGPTHLIKLRHPRLLTVEHQVEESGDTLAFVTEPIFASLSNLLGHYDNMPSPLPLIIKEHQLHPIEIQHGLMQVAEALNFLHADVRMMHGNLMSHNIVVNAKGNWKVMGFNFCCYSQYQSEAQTSFAFREWDTRKPLHTNPSLDYLAPEYILSRSCGTLSDVFSYGMVVHAVYNGGRPLFENNNNMLSFKQNVEQVSRISGSALGGVPDEFKEMVRSMLAVEPSVRPDALQISKNPFFGEVAVSTLIYLDSLYEKKDIDKSQFFKKNLAKVMTKLPKRILHQRVLPPLAEEFRNHKMIPFVLPLVLLVAEDCTLSEYSSLVLPILAPAMKIQDPIQVPLIFLQKMDLLLKMTSQDDVQKHVLPMIITSLEAEHSQVQELCVSILPSFAGMVDYSSMKHSIIPRITALCVGARGSPLCIKCLVCLGQMLDILDKHIVVDQILPVLQHIPSREPGVLMAILGIFHQTLTKPKLGLDKKLLAETIIPYLMPISIDPSLNLKQFNQFMKVIREMLVKVESEQQSHLEQLSKMEEQTKSTVAFAREVAENKAMDDALNRLEGMFTRVDPREEGVAARRGEAAVKSGSFTSGTPPVKNENTNFLSGVNLSDLSSTFSSNSSFPRISEQPHTSATPTLTPATQPSPLLGGNTKTSGYQPPPVLEPQPPKGKNILSTDNALSASSSLAAARTSSDWSAGGILAPVSSDSSKPASTWSSGILAPTTLGRTQDSSSLFSGMTTQATNQTQPPGSAGGGGGIFGGMSVNQSPNLASQRSSQLVPNVATTGGMGMGPPLIPMQSGGGSASSSTSWSSGVQGQGGQSGSGGGSQQGWSSNLQGSGGMLGMQSSGGNQGSPGGAVGVQGMGAGGGSGGMMQVQGSGGRMMQAGRTGVQGSGGGYGGMMQGQGVQGSSSPQISGMSSNQARNSGWSGGMSGQQQMLTQQQNSYTSGGMSGQQQMPTQQQNAYTSGGMSGQQNSGWSSRMNPGNTANPGSVSGWSQSMQGGGGQQYGGQQYGQMSSGGIGMNQQGMSGASMGMGQNQQAHSGSGLGMGVNQTTGVGGWSSDMQSQYSSSLGGTLGGPQQQQQPLIASPGGVGVTVQGGVNKPAPGANPFADLSFLS